MKKRSDNARRQAAFCARKRAAGYTQIKVWVRRADVARARALLKGLRP